jgi:hypothetical protein
VAQDAWETDLRSVLIGSSVPVCVAVVEVS